MNQLSIPLGWFSERVENPNLESTSPTTAQGCVAQRTRGCCCAGCHFYVTHSITNSGRAVGLTSRHRAGIPEPQPADARVEWGEVNLCPTNRSLDFLCLTNPNPFAVDLSGWRLDGAVKFTFEGGTVVPAHGLLCVSPDVKAFRSRAMADGGRVRFVVGNYSGRLDRVRATVLKNVAGQTIVER